MFDWSDSPPYNISIWLHNASSLGSPDTFGIATAQPIIRGAIVQVSSPFDISKVAEIAPIGSNSSAIWLNGTQTFAQGSLLVDVGEEVYTARFATLEIWGSLRNGSYSGGGMLGKGATVAEWEVIVDGLEG